MCACHDPFVYPPPPPPIRGHGFRRLPIFKGSLSRPETNLLEVPAPVSMFPLSLSSTVDQSLLMRGVSHGEVGEFTPRFVEIHQVPYKLLW